jgi:putative acetyltransferase
MRVGITVRSLGDECDFNALRELFVEYEADLAEMLRHGSVPDVAALHARYAGNAAAFLAVQNGYPIGCVCITRFDSETALLARLFVRPQARGFGAARALVERAIAFARESGLRAIVLDTNKQQLLPAYRLYESLGFRECEPFMTVSYECPTFMELQLGSNEP